MSTGRHTDLAPEHSGGLPSTRGSLRPARCVLPTHPDPTGCTEPAPSARALC
ncbi:hypothetical protein H4W79_004934 [Nocardiopsis terrae]|uniref:Uncharacterized protein n=1 Tax=Nocardiopsis terrae TaxID=372655 RepID=A0ABR9HNX9_9ACTN|nr:hypothetical protein [Nocardiopsis terrae]MBE1460720.1 hypothetical protein [Nocardiopsis terrae]